MIKSMKKYISIIMVFCFVTNIILPNKIIQAYYNSEERGKENVNYTAFNNVIVNGDFESDFISWGTWGSNENMKIEIDSSTVKTGKKSAKICNNLTTVGRVGLYQKIDISQYRGKTLKVNQWIKSNKFSGNMIVRGQFKSVDNNNIGSLDVKTVDIKNDTEWRLSTFLFDIPNNSELKYIVLEYVYDNSIGAIWIDQIQSEIIDTIKTSNIIKNSSFEEELSYWFKWQDKGQFNVDIDRDEKVIGDKSLKIYSGTSEITRGIVLQKIIVPQSLQGKVINVNQMIKTQNFVGSVLRARVKFLDDKGNEISTTQINALGISSTQEWTSEEYNIFLPTDKIVNSISIEYMFEDFNGCLWIDELVAIEQLNKVTRNIIQNGSFESTIKQPTSIWTLIDYKSNSEFIIENSDAINGTKCLKITKKGQDNNPRILQTIQMTDELIGKTLRLSEFVKTDSKNILYKTLKFLDKDGKELMTNRKFANLVEVGTTWKEYYEDILIPSNSSIAFIKIEYEINNLEGSIYLDNIGVEPYVKGNNIIADKNIIELKTADSVLIENNIEPYNTTYKDLIITSNNSDIVSVKDNKITAHSKGITKLQVKQIHDNITLEIPVIVDGDNLNIQQITTIEGVQGNAINGKVIINQMNTNKYKYSVLIKGNYGYIKLEDDGQFKYYLDNNFYGNTSFCIKVEDNNGNIAIAQYNLKIAKRKVDLSDKKVLLVTNENTKNTGKINLGYSGNVNFEIYKNTTNGILEIDKYGGYIYTPKAEYYGYDKVQIKVTTDDNEVSIVEGIIYISPNSDSLLSKFNNTYPRTLLNQSEFNNIKNLINTDVTAKAWFNIIKKDADKILQLPVIQYEKKDGLRLTTTSVDYIEKLSFIYKITGDIKYADRAWKEIDNICKYINWNEEHFLDTATMAKGAAIGYDWLFDYLDIDKRNIIEKAIIEKALNKALILYKSNSGFTTDINNWNIVCNSGMIFSSLAIANSNNNNLTMDIIQKALSSIQVSLKDYFEDGSNIEGPAYWNYSMNNLVYAITSLDKVLGMKNEFNNILDFTLIAEYSIYINNRGYSFNYADSKDDVLEGYLGLWFAKQLNNSKYTEFTKFQYKNLNNVSLYNLIWYDPNLYNKEYLQTLDKYFNRNEIVTMRSSYISDYNTFVGLKGGTTGGAHGDLDIGSFVYDSLGVRWALDLGIEDYNLQGYWDSRNFGKRWEYYRKRAEGHNTLIVGDSINEDQIIGSTSRFIDDKLNVWKPYSILDMTPAYSDKAANITRKVELTEDRKNFIIEDKFLLKEIQDIQWQMHTDATVEIINNGKEIILYKNNQKLKMVLTSDCDIKFEVVDAVPSINSPSPIGQNKNTGIKKIIAKTHSISGFIRVEMIPLGDIDLVKSRIVNSGFEDKLNNWNIWSSDDNYKVIYDMNTQKEGMYSIKMYSASDYISRGLVTQKIYVSDYYSSSIKVSQWIKKENFNGKLVIRFSYYDLNGGMIGAQEIIPLVTSGTEEWKEICVEGHIPKDTTKIGVEYLYDNSCGEIWIDDIKHIVELEDLNSDGIIDILDVALMSQKYGKLEGNSNWNSNYDLNQDKIIDIYDIILISKKF